MATSGDTGGAVLSGFGKLPDTSGINVMVLYPEEGISEIQKLQMTSATGHNVKVLGRYFVKVLSPSRIFFLHNRTIFD